MTSGRYFLSRSNFQCWDHKFKTDIAATFIAGDPGSILSTLRPTTQYYIPASSGSSNWASFEDICPPQFNRHFLVRSVTNNPILVCPLCKVRTFFTEDSFLSEQVNVSFTRRGGNIYYSWKRWRAMKFVRLDRDWFIETGLLKQLF